MSSVENPSPSEFFSCDSVFAAERVVTQKLRGCYRSRAVIWLNSAAFNALRCSSREVLIYPLPRRTRPPGAAQRSACVRKASSPSRGATLVFFVCDAAGQFGGRRTNPEARRERKMASQFLAHMRHALAHLGRSDCRVMPSGLGFKTDRWATKPTVPASPSAREDYPKAEHGGRAAQLQRNRCPAFCRRAPARLAGTLTPPGGASAPLGIPARPAR